jgi:hypothetical protein
LLLLLFVILLWVFIFILIFFFSFCTINFTITIFSSLFSPPSLSLLLLCYNPLFSFSTTFSGTSHLCPCLHLPFPSSPNLSPHYQSLLHIHHLLTNQLYQLYTQPPTSYNPWHKHPTLQQQKYTRNHTRATKPSSPHIASLTHPPHFLPPLLVPP